MALHDYRCSLCGARVKDHYVPIALRASEAAPLCSNCQSPMTWIPQVGRIDALEPFHQFQTYVRQPDGSEKLTTIGSLHQMRTIERESEQRAKNGEGQQMVWRDYSQERGTGRHLEHSFAADPSVRPEKNSRVKVTAVPEAEVNDSYGPGVGDHNTSALVVD